MTGRDLGFLKSIFRLSPKLKDECRFVGSERRRAAGRLADVVFINADAPEALQEWHALAPDNPLTTPIMVSARGEQLQGVFTLKQPLVLKRVLDVLEHVTDTSRGCRSAPGATAALSVLVVDDSFPVRKYMETRLHGLTMADLDLDFAASGEEAIAKAAASAYVLVFLDVVMPGIDGYKTCKLVKKSGSPHVVMLTSKKSPFDKLRGSMSGCDAYITKPPQDERLRKVIMHCLEKKAVQPMPAGVGSRAGVVLSSDSPGQTLPL